MRRTLTSVLVALLVISAVAVGPVSGQLLPQDDDKTIIEYGAAGYPSFVVNLENQSNAVDALHNWANTSDKRQVVRVNNQSKTATVAAPRDAVMGGLLNILTTPLAQRSYVDSVSPNYELTYAAPVNSLITKEEFPEADTIGLLASNDPARPLAGIAFKNDTNTTTLAEARGYMDADAVDTNTSGLLIGVIDTGANVDANGTLYGNNGSGTPRIHNLSKNFITNESIDKPSDDYSAIQDKNGHGSWVLSAMISDPNGTKYDGVAPNATGLVLKAMNEDGSGSTSDIARAIRYAAGDNPQNVTVDVLSMSLGSLFYSQAIAEAVDYAVDQGVVVVVAAGNSRVIRSPGIASPADHPAVITVGATNGSEPGQAGSAYFSQAGPDPGTLDDSGGRTQGARVEVVAPGMRIEAKVLDTDKFVQKSSLSGTSMATPLVSAAIAKAMAANSTLNQSSPATIREQVNDTAEAVPHAAVAEAGHGMVQVDKLANGNESGPSQAEAMTDGASQRDNYYEAASDAAGGILPLQAAPARALGG